MLTIPLGIGGIGFPEITIALVVLLLLFGGRKLPELARAMGSSITMFKRGLREDPDRIEGGEKPEDGPKDGPKDGEKKDGDKEEGA